MNLLITMSNPETPRSFWKSQRVLLTGGGGFLGSFVVDKLRENGCSTLVVPRQQEYDLRRADAVEKLFDVAKPTLVIHVAGATGGIGANQRHPGPFFYDNAIMGILMMEQARQRRVEKYVQIGTVCSYPKFAPVPFKEADLWNGYPEETNAPYGLAKIMTLVQGQAYRKSYGFNSIHLLLTNIYGPRDSFDLENSHTIPSLIRKCLEAKEKNLPEIEAWGTGTPSREFLYVEDAAEAILLAAQHYNSSDPVNVGAGSEVTIRDLTALIVELCDFKGNIRWNSSKPDGQPRRCLDVSRAQKEFGFRARTPLREGLKCTLSWYRQNRGKLALSSPTGKK